MVQIEKNKLNDPLIFAYFFVALIEIVAEVLVYEPLVLFSRIVIPVILLILYSIRSKKKSKLFFSIILLQLITSVFFIYTTSPLFIYGIFSFLLLRILSLVIVFKLTKEKNYLYIIVATFPFLLVFFYLISVVSEIPELELNLLIFQSVLISVLGGISVVNYMKSDNKQHSWLLISTLLYIGLRFIIFIERYFLADTEPLIIYRPMEVILTVFALFSFYKFVLAAESNLENNYKTA